MQQIMLHTFKLFSHEVLKAQRKTRQKDGVRFPLIDATDFNFNELYFARA
jgi:hypothetical protein